MVDEAQGLRARVLADLSRRRKVLHAQIEQLRAGRERLAETVQDVRRSIDAIAEDLFAAEDNARLAAEAAGRDAAARPEEGTPEELAAYCSPRRRRRPRGRARPPSRRRSGPGGCRGRRGRGRPVDGRVPADGDRMPPSRGRPAEPLRSKSRRWPASPSTPCSPSSAPPAAAGGRGYRAAPGGGGTVRHGGAGVDPGPAPRRRRRPRTRTTAGHPTSATPWPSVRDELIDPIVTALARRLKRTLQDNQNELLDRLRSKGSTGRPTCSPTRRSTCDSLCHRGPARPGGGRRRPASSSPERVRARPGTDVLPGHRPRAGRVGGRPAAAPAVRR